MKNKPVFFRRYGVSLALAVVGGFLEAYTYVTRDGVFANAQTGNIARMGIYLAQGNIMLTLRYLVPVIAFVAGVTLSLQLRRLRRDWERVILLLEIVLLFLVGLIPPGKFSVLATVTVAFVCALQVESFRKFGENTPAISASPPSISTAIFPPETARRCPSVSSTTALTSCSPRRCWWATGRRAPSAPTPCGGRCWCPRRF